MSEVVIYILEPDAGDRRSIAEPISSKDVEVKTFRSPSALLTEIEPSRPGCVLSEVYLSEMTGLELQAILLRDHPALAIIFITRDQEVETAVQAMKQGAVDYLQKPLRPALLLRAMNEAIAVATAWHKLQQEREKASLQLKNLTQREGELIPYLAYGWTNKEIAAKLHLSIRTVEYYRRSTFEKMKISSPLSLLRPWLLLQASSPRCLELFRHNLTTPRLLGRCPHPGCAAVGSVTHSPPFYPRRDDESLFND